MDFILFMVILLRQKRHLISIQFKNLLQQLLKKNLVTVCGKLDATASDVIHDLLSMKVVGCLIREMCGCPEYLVDDVQGRFIHAMHGKIVQVLLQSFAMLNCYVSDGSFLKMKKVAIQAIVHIMPFLIYADFERVVFG